MVKSWLQMQLSHQVSDFSVPKRGINIEIL